MNKIKQILPNIYCLEFTNNQSLGLSFIRISEHYEGPAFRHKIFTLKEYKKWYCENLSNGCFDYCTFYTGFNIPDYAFNSFIQGYFNPLTKNEKNIIEQVKNLPKPFCLIGINKKHKDYQIILQHEITHGLWYTNKQYKKEMEKLIAKIPISSLKKFQLELKLNGYHMDVYMDEIQAYLSDETGVWSNEKNPLFIKFSQVFKKYFKVIPN